MALPFPARGRDKDQAGSMQGANNQLVGPLQGPCFTFQFTPGLFKAGAFNHPGLFKFAPFQGHSLKKYFSSRCKAEYRTGSVS
jgi:hypothetical protein